MNNDALIAFSIEQLTAETRRLQMAEQVQKGMWLLLVRQLATRGQIDIDTLAADISTMSEAQDHEDWITIHEGYSDLLRFLKTGA